MKVKCEKQVWNVNDLFSTLSNPQAQDSSDDTIINSSVNEDYADTFEHDGSVSASVASRKKLPVGKLLPQGKSPLPSPWSRKAGSESESEDSISHTGITGMAL